MTMQLFGCFQCNQLPIERGPVRLTNPKAPKPQVPPGPSVKPPATPSTKAPKLLSMSPNRMRNGTANQLLVFVGSGFSPTSQIFDVHAGATLPTTYSTSTQVSTPGYTIPKPPGNYQYYIKDSVSGLKSTSLTLVSTV